MTLPILLSSTATSSQCVSSHTAQHIVFQIYSCLAANGDVVAALPKIFPDNAWNPNFSAALTVPCVLSTMRRCALGNYEGGRMLFLGLGTGLGSRLDCGRGHCPPELGQLPYPDGPRLDQVLGRRGLQRRGKRFWRRRDGRDGADPDGGVPGGLRRTGGECQRLKELPPGPGWAITRWRFGAVPAVVPGRCRRCRAMTSTICRPRARWSGD